MSFDWTLALRYLQSKKRSFISVGTLFAILGVALGVAALATVMSVTGGFQKQFRDKVLGVNAHVLILKRTPEFHEYRARMDQVAKVPGVAAVAPFVINPMLVTAGEHTATGVLMKGVDPERLGQVLDMPKQIVQGSLAGLRRAGAKPPERPKSSYGWDDKPFFAPTPTPPSASAPQAPASAPAPSTPTPTAIASAPSAPAPSAPSSAPEAPSAPPAASTNESDPFLHLMEKTLKDKQQENEQLAKGDGDAGAAADADGAEAAAAGTGPVGAMEPDGGYASQLPPDDEENSAVEAINKADEAKIKDTDIPGVAIGATLAKSLAVGVGDRIRITSPAIGFSLTGSSRAPVARSFRVIAIFEAGFDQYDSKLVYVDLYESQAFYDQGDSVTGIEMRVSDIEAAPRIKADIEKLLNNGVYHVMDWEELNHPLFTALKIQQIGMSAVLALIILVAAFTVVATLIMVVLDKKKEISVLKAMGATNSAILRVFLYQGGIIGGIGTLGGLGVGYLVCKSLVVWAFPLDPKVYFISHLPVLMRWQEFAVTGGVAVALCLLATVLPSLYAAGIRPAEGFREQ